MVAGKSFFFSKIGVQSCVRFRCTLLHSYFALHIHYKTPLFEKNLTDEFSAIFFKS